MKVLMISTDSGLINRDSAVTERIMGYGKLADELHIILLCLGDMGNENKITLADNVFVYPTYSRSKLGYIKDAVKIGRRVVPKDEGERDGWLITSQDPFETGIVGYVLHLLRRAPLNVQVHTDFLSKYFAHESFKNWLRVQIGRQILKRAKNIRVVSKRIMDSVVSVIKLDPGNIFTLPVLVDIKRKEHAEVHLDLHRKYMQFNFVILMACRFAREKNIPLALTVLGEVIKAYPGAGLILVGDGPELDNIKKKVRELGIEKNVVIEDWANDLTSYYESADLFLMTSNYEGYGRTMVEAVAAGCPIVTTNVGLAGELIIDGYNGLVSPVGNKKELVTSVKKLISDKALRLNFVNSASHSLKDNLPQEYFNREAYLAKFKEIWRKTLEK